MFDSLFNLMGMMFLVIVVGFLLRKKGAITDAGRASLINIILQVIIPFNIIKAFLNPIDEGAEKFALLLIVGLLVNGFYMVLSKYLFCKFEQEEKPVYQYGTVCPNAGFIGNPLVEGVFGLQGLTYASIFMLPGRIVMWTAGVSYFEKNANRKEAYIKVLTNPCMVATYIGIFIMSTKIALPNVIETTVTTFSNCCTALTMMYVGTILADVDRKNLITKKIMSFCVLRLVLIPLAIYIVCRVFQVDALATGVAVILAATPAGSTTSLLAGVYNADQKTATKLVVLSTLFSIITIPIWSIILLNGLG